MGFALGLDRTLLACDAESVFPSPRETVRVFVVDTTGGGEALRVAAELRAADISTDRAFEQRSMKAQMKAADRSGAEIALIIGSDELASDSIVMRLMSSGEQTTVKRANLIETVQRTLAVTDVK